MSDEKSLFDMFGVDLGTLTELVKSNPSLRGIIIGYLAERKLWDFFASDDRITQIRKDDDHDRTSKGDLVITYKGFDFRIEVKSLQTNSVRMFDEESGLWLKKVTRESLPAGVLRRRKWLECDTYSAAWTNESESRLFKGSVQCDASDNREITLPNGNMVKTTNLLVGEFDLLAMCLFAFREKWEFAFALNESLPRTASKKYGEKDRPFLLKTLISVEWPLKQDHASDPFILLDQLVKARQSKKPSPAVSGKR